jgi:hypothetical protein
MVATAIRQVGAVASFKKEYVRGSLLSAAAEAETDEELVKRALAGDTEAAEALLQRYRYFFFGMLVRVCREVSDAEELFQEAFHRASDRATLVSIFGENLSAEMPPSTWPSSESNAVPVTML